MKLVHDPLWRDRWDWVRKGLEEVRAKTRERWRPEDIYVALTNRAAFLFMIGDEGFCIVQSLRSSYENVLHVWIMWAPPMALLRHKDTIMAALHDIARSEKLTVVRMQSPRDEWKALDLFVPVSTIYEREVTP